MLHSFRFSSFNHFIMNGMSLCVCAPRLVVIARGNVKWLWPLLFESLSECFSHLLTMWKCYQQCRMFACKSTLSFCAFISNIAEIIRLRAYNGHHMAILPCEWIEIRCAAFQWPQHAHDLMLGNSTFKLYQSQKLRNCIRMLWNAQEITTQTIQHSNKHFLL